MITQIFPKDFQRYLSLPVLGPSMDSFAAWLQDRHYTWRSTRFELRMAARVCGYLKRRGVRTVADLSEQHLQACYRLFRRKFPKEAGSVRVVATFLFEHGWVQRSAASQPSRADVHLNAFMTHLRDARGYAPSTIRRQVDLAGEFLVWLNFENEPHRLSSLSIKDMGVALLERLKKMGRSLDTPQGGSLAVLHWNDVAIGVTCDVVALVLLALVVTPVLLEVAAGA